MDSILDLDIPYLPSLSITTSSATNLQVLSHISWETNPCTPTLVLVTVPARVPGAYEGGWTFMEASWIPKQKHVKTHLIEASQHKSSVGPIVRPPYTYMNKYAANNPSNLCLKTHGLWQAYYSATGKFRTNSYHANGSFDSSRSPMAMHLDDVTAWQTR